MQSKSAATRRIQRLIEEIPGVMGVTPAAPEFIRWQRSAEIAIERIFGEYSRHVREFNDISFVPFGVVPDLSNRLRACNKGLVHARAILESMLEEISEDWSDDNPPQVFSEPAVISQQPVSNRVFVVHGRDDGAKNTVARFLESFDLEAVILHERPNEGRTIIEKFEEYADVGFVVVLCTPDDIGALASEADKLRPRPRQNVVLELGFFLGKLGRNRVSALLDGDIDMPSDYGGVLYIPFDDSEGWKLTLARELRAAGMTIDMNLIV